jgi:hypothetical protein
MDFHHLAMAGSPQSRLRHPLSERLLAHRNLVHLVQVLGRQRRPEPQVHRVGEDRDGLLFQLGRQFPIRRSPSQLMDDRLVSFPPQFAQESPHLSLRHADLRGCLLLGNQFLLGLLQGHQPVSLGLGHQ